MKLLNFTALSMAFLTVSTTSSSAQSIRWKPETMMPGDYVTIKSDDQTHKRKLRHVFQGQSGKSFILDTYEGAKPIFRTYLDKNGNYLRWVHSDGYSVKFRPHDCKRTLGQCTYRILHSDGTRDRRTRVTQPTTRGYSFKEYDSTGQFLFGGSMALDTRGMAGNGKIKSAEGTLTFRVAKTFYQ